MSTVVIDSPEKLQAVYDDVANDFNGIDYTQEMMRELDHMARLHQGFFDSETGPDGAHWKENAPSTIKRKGHELILRGIPKNKFRLSRSLTAKGQTEDAVREVNRIDTGTYLGFGSLVPYSAIHDEDHQTATGAFVPARRHVGLTEEFVDQMVERVADFTVHELSTH